MGCAPPRRCSGCVAWSQGGLRFSNGAELTMNLQLALKCLNSSLNVRLVQIAKKNETTYLVIGPETAKQEIKDWNGINTILTINASTSKMLNAAWKKYNLMLIILNGTLGNIFYPATLLSPWMWQAIHSAKCCKAKRGKWKIEGQGGHGKKPHQNRNRSIDRTNCLLAIPVSWLWQCNV